MMVKVLMLIKSKPKALENGLMTEDQKLEAQEILQYIFHLGLVQRLQ
jgi:chemotaxis protein histidine kinase CheA